MKPARNLFLPMTTWSWGILLFSFILTGCEDCRTINCGAYQQYSFTLVGFNPDEIDNIEIRSFKKGTNFTEPVSEWVITPDNALYVSATIGNGYLISLTPGKSNFKITSTYDYEFYFPSTTTRRRLSEITDVASQQEHCTPSSQRGNCNNTEISSCVLDGTVYEGVIPSLSR